VSARHGVGTRQLDQLTLEHAKDGVTRQCSECLVASGSAEPAAELTILRQRAHC
jgi:hypothetical protein